MIMNPKVSVIIPVYNTADYVEQAVECILNQTLRDIEILIVDDGSTDNSLNILKKVRSNDPRVKLITQPNQGQSIARNNALKEASGKYLYFMDSDDTLDHDALELCFLKCEKFDLDFVFFDADIIKTNDMDQMSFNYQRKSVTDENTIYDGNAIFFTLLNNKAYSASPCLSFINHDYLKKIKLNFQPGIIHEDELFTSLLYIQATKVMAIHRSFFHRRIRPDSTMTKAFSSKNIHGYLFVANKIVKYRRSFDKDKRRTIDLFLSKMLNAAVWRSHEFPFKQRLFLLSKCITKYGKYVSMRTISVLLFKPYLVKKH